MNEIKDTEFQEAQKDTLKEIDQLFNALAVGIFNLSLMKIHIDSNVLEPMSAATFKQSDKVVKKFLRELTVTIVAGGITSWRQGERFGRSCLNGKVPENILTSYEKLGLFAHRKKAMNEFLTRKVRGLQLSKRVWNLEPAIRAQIEQTVQLGILEGKSAIEIASSLKTYLKRPDMLFYRVRDEKGKLHLSRRAKAYHPGQGVYRSSIKNAKRLALNEINKSYRVAQWEQMQQLDFIVGMEIRLSNNHPVPDMCDELAGIYPKNFKWSGWHVGCRCSMVSVLASEKDFIDYQKSPNPEPFKQITDYPPNMKKWATSKKDKYRKDVVDWVDENPEVLKHFK